MSQDLARIRLDNALRLFDEFVQATVKHPDAATLRGLERRFAERLAIQPSYWSQIKSRARQIGERLARQFEIASHKPHGWMDTDHGATAAPAQGVAAPPTSAAPPAGNPTVPQDDDERFIVGLVLSYYRRHPQRARQRLLELLGEALEPPTATPTAPAAAAAGRPPAPVEDPHSLWTRSQRGVAPLKTKRR